MSELQSGNVDPNEVAKFQALARRWWDPESEFRPLHQINPLRLGYIRDRAELRGARALDVGCGGGILTESLAYHGASVIGIDAGATAIEVGSLHLAEANLKRRRKLDVGYRQQTIEEFAATAEGERFDLITCMEMLEHVPDPAAVIATARALLQPNGALFLSTINRTVASYVKVVVGAEYILNLLPRGTHDYGKFIRPSEVAAWLRAASFDLVEMIGLTYNPLARRYRLTTSVDANYMVYAKPR